MKALCLTLMLFAPGLAFPSSTSCKIYPVTRGEMELIKETNQDLKSVSRSVNEVIRSSFEVINRIDHATLGLASAYLTGGKSLDQLEPNEWGKAHLVGGLVYKDQPFSLTSLRGVNLTLIDRKNRKWTETTGTDGEFAFLLYDRKTLKQGTGHSDCCARVRRLI